MIKQIQQHLKELAQQKGIKLLLAVESGSRAWGFPSPDSDYDVRIIYAHPQVRYLSVNQPQDTINYFHGKLLDINGWDIRKTLNLLRKSNATPFEWAQSPIVYYEADEFKTKLLELAKHFFQPRHTLNHYRGIAKNSYLKNPLGDAIKLKKLFYVIRPVLAARWIIERKTVPPMDIDQLLPVIAASGMQEHIRQLIKLKSGAGEDFVYNIDPLIRDFVEEQFILIENAELDENGDIPDVEVLNTFFRDVLPD